MKAFLTLQFCQKLPIWALGVTLIAVLSLDLQSQRSATLGEWTAYVSHQSPNKIVPFGSRFAVATDGGLYVFDTLGQSFETYTKVEGLSGESPDALHYDQATGTLFIGYRDGRIDYTRDPASGFQYVTDISRSELFTSKSILDMTSSQGLLYAATSFGIVVYDFQRGETRSAVTKIGDNVSGLPVLDLLISQDTLYAAMGSHGIWKAGLSHPNITLPDAWVELTGRDGLRAGYGYGITYAGGFYFAGVGDTLYRRPLNSYNWSLAPFPAKQFNEISGNDGYLVVTYENVFRWRDSTGVQQLFFTSSSVSTSYMDSTRIMVGDTLEGVYQWLGTDSLAYFVPSGPRNNKVSQLAVGNGMLVIAPEGKLGQSQPAETRNGFYTFEHGKGWKVVRIGQGLDLDVYKDFARVLYVPNTDQFFLGSWNHGVLEYSRGEVTHRWTPLNSNLSGSSNIGAPDNIRVSGLAYDKNGVLWATGILADQNLNALDPVDSTWHRMHVSGTEPIGIIVDDWNNKWIINQDNGLVVFNENGTLDNNADNQIRRISTVSGQGGLPNNSVYDLAKDQRGHIWVGTLQGVAVFANPGAAFSNNFPDASCPIIEGFCLLRDQRVTAIAVDGANRKWIGTTNGVYVVNPQGNKLLYHYTSENSPLFNNEIRDIAIDPKTGEVYIGTSKGLLSLMADAVDGKDDSDSLYVFPNPIPVDYEGPVAINGSVKDAEVKITTVSGQLVRSLVSTGGQTVWDGKDAAGNTLLPGVYLAMVATKDRTGGGIAKFIVLARQE